MAGYHGGDNEHYGHDAGAPERNALAGAEQDACVGHGQDGEDDSGHRNGPQQWTLGDAGVIVVLGNNQADKSLEQLAEAGGLTTPELGVAPTVALDVVAPEEPATTDG